MDAPVTPSMMTIGSGFEVAVIGIKASTSGAGDGCGGDREHGGLRADARDDQSAADGTRDAAEIERGDAVAGDRQPEPGPSEHRRHPVERGVDGEHAREHRAPERHGVAAEVGSEQRANRRAGRGCLAQVDEGAAGRDGAADLAEDALELRPAFGVPGQIPWGFGQEAHEEGGDDERQYAAEGEERTPAPKEGMGMMYPAPSAASVPPSGTQTIVSVMANGRYRRGTYSDASAAALGIAPPSPSPARKRRAPRAQRLSTSATAAVRMPKMRTLPMSAKRRPIRSPMRPASAPPIIMPIMPLASTALNSARGTAQSRIIAGMAMPSSWLSMPSNTIVSAVRKTKIFCRRPQRPSSSRWPMSIG